ncbi:MAG: dTMP kinase [Solirubrobacterales bacterium]
MGLLITFEGIDGVGKTTQMQRLSAELLRHGVDVLALREPGGNEVSERIREVLLDTRNHGILPVTEAFLYASARAQLVAQVLKPALDAGKVVLMDRFVDSTIAYQGYGRGLSIAFLNELNSLATGGLTPDLTILLDMDPAAAVRRSEGTVPDRIEREGVLFLERVRTGYLELAKSNARFRQIDAAEDADAVYTRLSSFVFERLEANDGQN